MIYLDSSVALAALLAESRSPPASFWRESLVASRLLEYEVFVRLNARGRPAGGVAAARELIGGLTLLDLAPAILARAVHPFPVSVRTLDGLHLASMDFLRARGQAITLATYDRRFADAATALGFALADV